MSSVRQDDHKVYIEDARRISWQTGEMCEFASAYACTMWDKGARRDDAARIVASIDRGLPVLAFQVVSPSDCCIITGYDEDGTLGAIISAHELCP